MNYSRELAASVVSVRVVTEETGDVFVKVAVLLKFPEREQLSLNLEVGAVIFDPLPTYVSINLLLKDAVRMIVCVAGDPLDRIDTLNSAFHTFFLKKCDKFLKITSSVYCKTRVTFVI
jgi:hypothetical protein